MKAVKRSELVIGKLYADCVTSDIATIMRLEKVDEKYLYFKYHSGEHTYNSLTVDGLLTWKLYGDDFYEVEETELPKPTELSPESLATITTALRRYFDDYPIVKGSKEDDVINATDELIEKFDIKQLKPLRDEMNKDLGFESNQESTTNPNEDRENDSDYNNERESNFKNANR